MTSLAKNLIVTFFIFTAIVSAQEYWGNPELIFEDGSGFGQYFDPCFTNNPDQVLISIEPWNWFDYKRIALATGRWEAELFFPDSVTGNGHDDTPFMTDNGNTIYFSSDRPDGQGGFDIWLTENINGSWTIPTNLGPNVNSELDEISPSLMTNNGELFFIRGNYYGHDHIANGVIMQSQFSNGQWQEPFNLPESINSNSVEFSPSISGDGSKLYFISRRENNLPGASAVWVSQRIGNEWGDPYMPDGSINEYYQDCPPWWSWYGYPMSVCVGADNSKIVYVKGHHFLCFEANSLVYIAERMTDIKILELDLPENISLTAYPNPFNSSVNITTGGISNGSVEIYNLLGQKIREFDINQTGEMIVWDGKNSRNKDCPSGVYFVKLKSENRKISHPLTLIR